MFHIKRNVPHKGFTLSNKFGFRHRRKHISLALIIFICFVFLVLLLFILYSVCCFSVDFVLCSSIGRYTVLLFYMNIYIYMYRLQPLTLSLSLCCSRKLSFLWSRTFFSSLSLSVFFLGYEFWHTNATLIHRDRCEKM